MVLFTLFYSVCQNDSVDFKMCCFAKEKKGERVDLGAEWENKFRGENTFKEMRVLYCSFFFLIF